MKTLSYTEARETLASAMDKVCEDHVPIVITRKRHRAIVMLSLEDFESLQETAYLTQNPANAKRLMSAVEALEKGKGKSRKIDLGK